MLTNTEALESFVEICNEMEIVNESFIKQYVSLERHFLL